MLPRSALLAALAGWRLTTTLGRVPLEASLEDGGRSRAEGPLLRARSFSLGAVPAGPLARDRWLLGSADQALAKVGGTGNGPTATGTPRASSPVPRAAEPLDGAVVAISEAAQMATTRSVWACRILPWLAASAPSWTASAVGLTHGYPSPGSRPSQAGLRSGRSLREIRGISHAVAPRRLGPPRGLRA
jgi:hypothetical protein